MPPPLDKDGDLYIPVTVRPQRDDVSANPDTKPTATKTPLGAIPGHLYIPVTVRPQRDNVPTNLDTKPQADKAPSIRSVYTITGPEHSAALDETPATPRSTKSVYTITSSVSRDRRKNRLADNPHPTALPTPPRSISTSSGPSLYPEANTIHHYTHCPHTSPPCTRPLDVKPTLIHSTSRSTLLGRCYDCDVSFRRERETIVLQTFQKESEVLHGKLLAAREALMKAERGCDVDEVGIERVVSQIDKLVNRRERDVKSVWAGFSKRWGPGTVGVQDGLKEGGRMDVKWVRPEKESSAGK